MAEYWSRSLFVFMDLAILTSSSVNNPYKFSFLSATRAYSEKEFQVFQLSHSVSCKMWLIQQVLVPNRDCMQTAKRRNFKHTCLVSLKQDLYLYTCLVTRLFQLSSLVPCFRGFRSLHCTSTIEYRTELWKRYDLNYIPEIYALYSEPERSGHAFVASHGKRSRSSRVFRK